MRTYTHGIIGYLIYLKTTQQQKILAIFGAILPDLILAIGFIFHFLGNSQAISYMHNLFHHSILHDVTKLMHSFALVIPLLILCLLIYKKALPFFVGMLSHVILDFLTHQKMGYNILYPFNFPIFSSQISYTSTWFTILEHLFVIGFIVWFYKNRKLFKSTI